MTSCDLLHQYDHHPFGKLEQLAQFQVERTQIIDEQLEHIPHEALRMMDSTHCGSPMIENHSRDRLVKEVLMMVLMMRTEENDTVFHIAKTGMLMLVVEINVGGMTVDVVDKLTCSSDDVQPRQVDLRKQFVKGNSSKVRKSTEVEKKTWRPWKKHGVEFDPKKINKERHLKIVQDRKKDRAYIPPLQLFEDKSLEDSLYSNEGDFDSLDYKEAHLALDPEKSPNFHY
nr:hypothetical protein [Tanacetum cinerariifolium]